MLNTVKTIMVVYILAMPVGHKPIEHLYISKFDTVNECANYLGIINKTFSGTNMGIVAYCTNDSFKEVSP